MRLTLGPHPRSDRLRAELSNQSLKHDKLAQQPDLTLDCKKALLLGQLREAAKLQERGLYRRHLALKNAFGDGDGEVVELPKQARSGYGKLQDRYRRSHKDERLD